MDSLSLIKSGFEQWYNRQLNHGEKVSVVISYSDEQTLLIKAYHKVTVRLAVIGIRDNLSYTLPLLSVSENYNHGVTSEEEVKEHVTSKFLSEVLDYCSKGKIN